jgi:hypothetical protein
MWRRKWKWLGDMTEEQIEFYKAKQWFKREIKEFFGKEIVP